VKDIIHHACLFLNLYINEHPKVNIRWQGNKQSSFHGTILGFKNIVKKFVQCNGNIRSF